MIEFSNAYVDLGLPSGTLWAVCNIGARQPYEYGEFFRWGESTRYLDLNVNAPHTDEIEIDIVNKIMGGNWSTPTCEDAQELLNNTKTTIMTYHNIKCLALVSKINGKKIFFPLSGYYPIDLSNAHLRQINNSAYIWLKDTRTAYSTTEIGMLVFDRLHGRVGTCSKLYGQQFRGVIKK